MADRDAARLVRHAKRAHRIVHRVHDVAVLEEVAHFLHRHHRAVVLGLLGRRAEVRDHEAALLAGRRGVREVAHVLADLPRLERRKHVLLVHERVARRVDDDDARLHHRNRVGVDHALRGIERRHVDGDEIAVLVDVLDVLAVLHRTAQVPGRVNREVGVEAADLHAEADRRVRDLLSDRAEADDAELFAHDFRASKGLLRLLGRLVDRGIRNVLLDPVDAADDVAARQEHARDHELLDAVRIRARGVENDNALLGILRMRDVVDARARTRHGEQVRAGGQLVHLGGTDEDGIGLFELLGPRIVFGEVVEPARRNRVQAVVLVVHSVLLSSVEFIMEFPVTHDG